MKVDNIYVALIVTIVISCLILPFSYNQAVATVATTNSKSAEESKLFSKYTTYIEYCIKVSMKKNNISETGHRFAMDFNVDKNGNITEYGIIISSDLPSYDKSVIAAVLSAGPFQPFPEGLNKELIAYQMHFEGCDTSISSYAKARRLTYKVNQNDKPRNPIKMSDVKNVFTNSIMPFNLPSKLRFSMSKQVQSNWNPPLDKNSEVQVSFMLSKLGTVHAIKIEKSSYYEDADRAAVSAIKSLKLCPMAFEMLQLYVPIKYIFFVRDLNN